MGLLSGPKEYAKTMALATACAALEKVNDKIGEKLEESSIDKEKQKSLIDEYPNGMYVFCDVTKKHRDYNLYYSTHEKIKFTDIDGKLIYYVAGSIEGKTRNLKLKSKHHKTVGSIQQSLKNNYSRIVSLYKDGHLFTTVDNPSSKEEKVYSFSYDNLWYENRKGLNYRIMLGDKPILTRVGVLFHEGFFVHNKKDVELCILLYVGMHIRYKRKKKAVHKVPVGS